MAIIGSVFIDWMYYGELTFVPWNFIHFNVLQGGSEVYGTHPFLWYFTHGYPAMLTVMIPAFICGLVFSRSWSPLVLIVFITLSYSFNPHKELRFVLPALSICFIYSGYGLNWLKNRKWKLLSISFFHLYLSVFVLINAIMTCYFSLLHQRAPVSVALYLGNYNSSKHSSSYPLKAVHFLTNCHATPFYSHVHHPIHMRQLDCSPQLLPGGGLDRSSTESEVFLVRPVEFVEAMYGIVIFNRNHSDFSTTDSSCANLTKRANCLDSKSCFWTSCLDEEHSSCIATSSLFSKGVNCPASCMWLSVSSDVITITYRRSSWKNQDVFSSWTGSALDEELPSHIVVFEEYWKELDVFFQGHGYGILEAFPFSPFDQRMFLLSRETHK
eukprot:TRINITY_DN32481_c0_g1_i1.p1 TRINITY_DN32481_c0_g1~~TRINITY_DN32481_c0_g1_i1.p1  ORF type:complete len:383 (-),score=57.69 TRINITY_DN32481_c0_g1_i1:8-1156(-)